MTESISKAGEYLSYPLVVVELRWVGLDAGVLGDDRAEAIVSDKIDGRLLALNLVGIAINGKRAAIPRVGQLLDRVQTYPLVNGNI